LLQFGDIDACLTHGYPPVPSIKKVRQAMTREQIHLATTNKKCIDHDDYLRQTRMHQIIWKLEIDHHYGTLYRIPSLDTPWEEKLLKAIFRGGLTGTGKCDDLYPDNPYQRCMCIPRCRLVYENANSTLLDARLTMKVPMTLNGVPLVGPAAARHDMMKHKALVFLEGNDVSTGVKWGLYSQSVVLMPPPTKTSWMMEECLEPWIHYVPIKPDLTDILEKIQWVLDHDAVAHRISQRATIWMNDLLFHPDAKSDDKILYHKILEYYRQHFA